MSVVNNQSRESGYRILLVEDHPLFRRGVKNLLTDTLDHVVVGEAKDAEEALKLVKTKSWDAIVLDITLPGRSGPDLLQDLKRAYPKLPVLVLSMHPEEQYAVRVFRAGADGYIRKNADPKEVVRAVKKILAGREYVTHTVGERLALNVKSEAAKSPHKTLSEQEYQVFCLLIAGKGLTEIAEDLNLNVTTISTYRIRILEKMNMTNNSELVRYGLKHALIE